MVASPTMDMGILSAQCRTWIPLLQARGKAVPGGLISIPSHQAQCGPSCPAATKTATTANEAGLGAGGEEGTGTLQISDHSAPLQISDHSAPRAIKEEIHLPQMLSGSLPWTPRESSSKGIVLYSILPWWFFSRDQHFLIRSDKYWVGGGEEKRCLIKHTNILLLLQKQG